METDWRWEILKDQHYLRGSRLQFRTWRESRPGWDHDHCGACSDKFAVHDFDHEHVLKGGYTTCADYVHGAEYEWICPICFADFKEQMGWSEVPPETD
jgi:hypothetical protein